MKTTEPPIAIGDAVQIYVWDRFLTVTVLADICAVAWLAYLAFRQRRTLAAAASG